MSRIPQETIDRINDSADIVDVVSKVSSLKKGGEIFSVYAHFMMKKRPHLVLRLTRESITVLAAVREVMP